MQVKFFATFRKITGEKEVQITGAGSVADLFVLLAARYALAAENNFLWRAGKIPYEELVTKAQDTEEIMQQVRSIKQ